MTIHNPTGATLSAKDILQGWRFCYAEELMIARPLDAKYKEHRDDGRWFDTSNPGVPVNPGGLNWTNTYITQTPAPKDITPPKPADDPDDIFSQLGKIFG